MNQEPGLIVNLKSHSVLVISPEGVHRDAVMRALRNDGFQPNFVTSLASVFDLLHQLKPATLLHDWAAVEPTQSFAFQQKLGRQLAYAELCRIVYADQVTPSLTALAFDAGIRRVINYSATAVNIAGELRMAIHAAKNLSVLQQKVRGLYSGTRYSQAEIDHIVEDAFRQYSHDPIVKIEFGNLRLRQGDTLMARQLASEVLTAHPHNVRAMNLIARSLIKTNRLDEAIKLLERANTLSPFSTDRLLLLGDAFFRSGDLGKAEGFYAEASNLDPSNQNALAGLGQIKLTHGDIEGALQLLQGNASEEEVAGFFNNAGIYASRSNKHEQALRLYETALRILHTDRLRPQLYFNLSMALMRLGRPEEALKAARRALKLDPSYEKAKRQVQRLLITAGKGNLGSDDAA